MAYTGNHAMGAASIIQRGGEQSARNIQAMGNILGQQKQQRMDNKEARKRYTSLLKELGQDPDALEGMSIGELEGTFQGVKEKFGQQYMQEKIQNAQMANQQMQAAMQAEEGMRRMYSEAAMARNPNSEYAQRYQQMLQNPKFATDVQMYEATGGLPPAWARERYAPWQPHFTPAEQTGGPAGGMVFHQSPNSAQFVPPGGGQQRKKPAEEVMVDAIRSAEEEGDAEMAGMLRQAWDKKMEGRTLSPMDLFLLDRLGLNDAAQAGGQSQPKPPAGKPMDRGSFFGGL